MLAGAEVLGLKGFADEVGTVEEFLKAGACDLVKNIQPPLFTDEKPSPLHDSKVLREGCDVASRHRGEVIHAQLTCSKRFHDEKAGRMRHGLYYYGPICCTLLQQGELAN